jgi:hypothetical protein
LVQSTVNRLLRTRDRMNEIYNRSEQGGLSPEASSYLVTLAGRVERQGEALLRALRAVYIALAAFACATLITLLGAGLGPIAGPTGLHSLAALGLLFGCVGVGGLVYACFNLYEATQMSVSGIRDEAVLVRKRQAARP